MDKNIDLQSDEQVLAKYGVLVKKIALKIISKLPANIQLDDLMQVGLMALIEAAKNYDSNRGASFATYAGIRVKGAIIDEVRREDWLPRSSHRNSKLLSDASDYVASHSGQEITVDDICQHLNITQEEYKKLESNKFNYKVYNFDDIGMNEDNISVSTSEKDIFAKVENNLLRNAINTNIKKLSVREQIVLILYYDNELSLKQIGELLFLTESRVCQIHSTAMKHLEKHMVGWR